MGQAPKDPFSIANFKSIRLVILTSAGPPALLNSCWPATDVQVQKAAQPFDARSRNCLERNGL